MWASRDPAAVEPERRARSAWDEVRRPEPESITARRGMRELLLRATLYRARLGEPGAMDAARSLVSQIDNPALTTLLDSYAPAPAAT